METLLTRLAPELAGRWCGASDDEIERVEQLAGRALPRFFRWLLLRMGRERGFFAYPSLDFSARRIIGAYDEAEFDPDPRFLMIGYETDQDMPLHVFYDLDHSVRDDARVGRTYDPTAELHVEFETLREMLAYGELLVRRVLVARHRCEGVIEGGHEDVASRLAAVMRELGFTSPITTGSFCTLHETSDATLLTTANPSRAPGCHPFYFGGDDVGRMRRILGQIAAASTLEVRVEQWAPPLR